MTNNKKSRFMVKIAAMLLGALLLSPILGKANPAAASSAVAAPDPVTIYLPLVMNNFPMQTVFGAGMDQITSAGGLDQMAAANMSWTRSAGVPWSSVEATEGHYDWSVLSGLDSELQNASHQGIQVVLIVHSTPEWARKIPGTGPSCGPISTAKLPAFGNFMHALVVHYSVAPYNVKYWEMWDEPDYPIIDGDSGYGCWGDVSDTSYYGGGYYAEMLKAVYPQIKAANSQAQVLVGGLLLDCDPRGTPSVCASLTPPHSDIPPKFLEGILVGGGGPYFDGVSFHAFENYYIGQLGQYSNPNWSSAWNITGPTFIAKAQFIQSILSQHGISGKFLMNTELALLCVTCSNDPMFETTKAYYVAQSYAATIAQGLRANIWYSVLGWRNSGLLNPDLSPRPAYTAFQFSRKELSDAAYNGVITAADLGGVSGVKGYKFQRGDRRIWVLWSLDGNPHSITLSSVPLAAWDALGVSVIPAHLMNVTLKPLYLEWNP